MTKSIPADFFVKVTPGVIGAGGNALDLNGLVLSPSTRVPVGSVYAFAGADAVAAFFGGSSDEAQFAINYFLAFDNSDDKPATILFAQYNVVAVAAYLRGGNVSGLTLNQLKALTGVLTVVVDGVSHTSGTINLSAATSFSNAATLILAGFTSPGFTVVYDSVSGAFVFTSATTGAASTMSFATGSLANGLALLLTDGAVTSQGADAGVPSTFLGAIAAVTQDWATFGLTFDPDGGSGNTIKLEFAAWVVSKNNRFGYIAWDPDLSPTTSPAATASMGSLLDTEGASGICPIYSPTFKVAAFIMGSVAALDFSRTEGRANFAYRSQEGLAADVVDETVASNLIANSYNFYGAVATANQGFTYFYPGSVTGEFAWLDSFVNQIKFNSDLQLAGMSLLTSLKSIPYNSAGEALIRQAFADPIASALNFGTIRTGVALSALQAATVNSAAGAKIDAIITTQGYYLQVKMPSAQVRAQRGSPICTLWYTDGGSINKLDLLSLEIQ